MPKCEFEGTNFEIAPNESMLDALIRGGANISFSCRKGTCHVCMLQIVEGDPGSDAVDGLSQENIAHGMFLPCRAHPDSDLKIERADCSKLYGRLYLGEREWLSESVCHLSFTPETQLDWAPGQFMNLRRSDGVVRNYSIASILNEDDFLSIHVKRIHGGVMSPWLCDELRIGDHIEAQGPVGTCYYEGSDRSRNMLMLATGSGLSPLYGICRDALRQGHEGKILLFHGSRRIDGLYLRDELRALAEEHPNFQYVACLSEEEKLPVRVERGRVVDLAFGRNPHLKGWQTYLCGIPDMVEEARCRAILAGVTRQDIKADPFEYAHRYKPDDSAKVASIPPQPELWEALEHGPGLTRILTAFYDTVYEDPRLSPFFHGVTKPRAIGQQYAFMADIFTGRKDFFGLKPFNAHHWMIISDELFDYREALLEQFLRAYGLSESLICRWSAIDEMFRREIVKGSARGMIIDGVEKIEEPPSMMTVEVGCVCDGCQAEISVGSEARYHPDSGKLFCTSCTIVRQE